MFQFTPRVTLRPSHATGSVYRQNSPTPPARDFVQDLDSFTWVLFVVISPKPPLIFGLLVGGRIRKRYPAPPSICEPQLSRPTGNRSSWVILILIRVQRPSLSSQSLLCLSQSFLVLSVLVPLFMTTPPTDNGKDEVDDIFRDPVNFAKISIVMFRTPL